MILDSCRKQSTNNLTRDIPLVITAFLLWKFIKRTKFVSLADVPIRGALDEIIRNPEPIEPKATGWRRIPAILWD